MPKIASYREDFQVELRNSEGQILPFAPIDLELVPLASAEQKVLRHGTEEEFQVRHRFALCFHCLCG